MFKIKKNRFLMLIVFGSLVGAFLVNKNTIISPVQPQSVESSSAKVLKECNDLSTEKDPENNKLQKLSCYRQRMEVLALKNGRDYTYQVLSGIQKSDPDAKNCHFIGHGIGEGLYKKSPTDIARLISESNEICGHGELMGIMEEYVVSYGKKGIEKKDVINLCGLEPYKDCNHAVGHMMLVISNNDLVNSKDLCQGLGEKSQIFMCYQGMIMERFVGEALRDHELTSESSDELAAKLPEYKKFCEQQSGQMLLACWREIAHPAFLYFERDPDQILKFCSTSSSRDAMRLCMVHSMQEISGSKNYDLVSLKKDCDTGAEYDPEFKSKCYQLLVSIKLNFISPEDSRDLIPFCNSLVSDEVATCYSAIGGAFKRLKTPELSVEKFCTGAPHMYKKHCLGGRIADQHSEIDSDK
ncbi:MAG TPA: hypothetical protein VM077_02705 [Candidatus Limnocylindrales bacterium]|nr:hypothetical protein [Candidatus Limnocylindrales bacterium]